jgi:2'-5' RNA ligase
MRLFVCTLLDEENQVFYGDRMAPLIDRHADLLRPIPPASAHITFALLTGVPDDDLVRLSGACADAAASMRSFRAALGAPFMLYGGSEARLVCVPVVNGTKELWFLERCLGAALTPLYSADRVKRTKSFHVTLARCRRNQHRNAAKDLDAELRRASPEAWSREQLIDHLEIVSSELRPGGPVYTTLHVIPMAGRS